MTPNPSQEPLEFLKATIQDLEDLDVLCNFTIDVDSHNLDCGVSKTSYHIQIKIKMPSPSLEPPASFEAPNEDLNDMDVLCTFKIKIESHNSDHGCVKDQWPYPN